MIWALTLAQWIDDALLTLCFALSRDCVMMTSLIFLLLLCISHTTPSAVLASEGSQVISLSLDTLGVASSAADPLDGRFSLKRPFSARYRQWAEPSYPYASRGSGSLLLHTGVDFINPSGTPVLSVAAGKVFFAGDDADQIFGPTSDYYGKLVLVKLDQLHQLQPIFVLYGHLSQIWVRSGDVVLAGQPIGAVGETGIATGPHLHFEVRLGDSSFGATRNPEIWLEPFPSAGTIVGRIYDAGGCPLPGVRVNLVQVSRPEQLWHTAYTYLNGHQVHSDDQWRENFLLADVPGGEYIVSIFYYGQTVRKVLHIEPRQVVFFDIELEYWLHPVVDFGGRRLRPR